ncbi:MAG: type II toxin-antitoxin system VapC family toxin [Betaproteobacteria bacterium]|nr:type II toxin-antitoxin system VapC family toxin [Betaproteobacteria bacterium]
MILYLDTSAFIKLYVGEPNADKVRAAVAEADQIHAHWIAYPEMRSALARLYRMGRQDAETFDQCKREFVRDWDLISPILPDESILRRAGELAERFGLRGYDSVHLAAAESLRVGQGADLLRFASFDERLNQSAEELGLRLLG